MRTVLIANRDRACRTSVLHLSMSFGAALVVLAVAAPAAAQRSLSDSDLLNRQHSGTDLSSEDRHRFDELKAQEAKHQAEDLALRQRLLRLPLLPVERNVLLGEWRIEGGGQGGGVTGLGQGKGTGGTDAMFRELWATLESNPDKLLCVPMFGDGITFAPSTYSIRALTGSVWGGSVDYRSTGKQVISAITRNWKILSFEIAGTNRIVFTKSCALVRVGAPAANAAPNTTAAPSNVRTTAASPSALPAAGIAPQGAVVAPAPPPSTLSRPSHAGAPMQAGPEKSSTAQAAGAEVGPARKPIELISRLGRGVQLHGQKDFQHALQHLLIAAQSDPNDPRVFVYLADTYAWLGMDTEAKQAAVRAKQLDPKAFEILR